MKDIRDVINEFRAGHHEFEHGHLEGFEGSDPSKLLDSWLAEAVEHEELEANAFVLSTVSAEGEPSGRILYLKDIIDEQLVFYTNYNSKKGRDIEANGNVAMLFFYPKTSRQIRIEGICTKLASEHSDRYFASRPRYSKLGAIASAQSAPLPSREDLENKVKELDAAFGEEIPRPDYWGGYQVKPTRYEFWQGRPSRLHDRIVFELEGEDWKITRINP
ncbi:MAG: pyridoxamine 5'-phosphate oxidase [Bacteroidetes bacterium]|nr:MAG: pyridoxamine 5'-phosphate oxidase [Bacteroidota bacterium]